MHPERICRDCGAVQWYRVDWGYGPWIPPYYIDKGPPLDAHHYGGEWESRTYDPAVFGAIAARERDARRVREQEERP